MLGSGRYPIQLPLRGKQWDTDITGEIVRVGLPLGGTRLAQTFGRFPFLFLLALLGTDIVAAYAIGRRVILLALMPAWGYLTTSSTLVGQSIGAGNEAKADAYGWQTLQIVLITQLLIAAVLIAGAGPIATTFDAQNHTLTVQFIQMFGLSVAGFSISWTLRGGLRGAGDTRWPFYGTMAGTYLVRLPIAALALPAGTAIIVFGYSIAPGLGVGLFAVYVAIVGDFYVRAAINVIRFRSGRWKQVARRSGIGEGDTTSTD